MAGLHISVTCELMPQHCEAMPVVRFEVLTTVSVSDCGLTGYDSVSRMSSSLTMEAVCFSETLICSYQTTYCPNTEDDNMKSKRQFRPCLC